MKTYTQNFTKTVWGYLQVEAESEQEAKRMFEEMDCDEIDHKSEYEFEDKMEELK